MVPYPIINHPKENESFLKWCFSNAKEGRDIWNTFAYKHQLKEPINLIGANLEKLDLQGIYLYGAKLGSVNFYRSILNKGNLSQANLIGANLKAAQCINTNFNETDFFKANLTLTNFSYANLKKSYFKDAILKETIFYKSNLEETTLATSIQTSTEHKEQSAPSTEELTSISESLNIPTPTVSSTQTVPHQTIKGYLELYGTVFHPTLDIQELHFFTDTFSSILSNSFTILNEQALQNNAFTIRLNRIEQHHLSLDLHLHFNHYIHPILLSRQTKLWSITHEVITTIKNLGKTFPHETSLNLQETPSNNQTLTLINSEMTPFTIKKTIYEIIHKLQFTIQELNQALIDNRLKEIILNNKRVMHQEESHYIQRGLLIFSHIKQPIMNDTFQALINIIEFNKETQQGKAIVHRSTIKLIDNQQKLITFDGSQVPLDTIIDGMKQSTFLANVKPIIEYSGQEKSIDTLRIVV